MKKIKIAVLGAGRWGRHLVRNFLAHPHALLVAVLDPKPELLAATRQNFDLNEFVYLAKDWSSLPKNLEIEAVAIATPAVTHYTLIREALQRGYHVLAEKPLTLDVAECIELCRLAQQQQRQLMVDHTYLFHPAVERSQEVVKSGRLGELRYGYGARTHLGPVRQDVDALWDLAIHDIAIFNNWLGQVPEAVQATGQVWLQTREGREGINSSLFQQGLADLVQVKLVYPTGLEAFVHLCWLNPDKQRRLCLVGSQGTLIFDEMRPDAPLTIQSGHFEQNAGYFIPVGQSCQVLNVEKTQPLGRICNHFLRNINDSQFSTISDGWVGTQLVQILSCLSQSLQLGGCLVKVPPLPNERYG
ncbi:MAG: Gfo/Idh/MocA family oxidoreductase [Coleofasciculaceae cyanobacterium]